MTIKQLHSVTGKLIAKEQGDHDVTIDIATFSESENGTILMVESAKFKRVQGADDSGPVGPMFTMLVLSGGFQS